MPARFSSYPKQLLVVLLGALSVFVLATIGFIALMDEVLDGDTLKFDETVLLSINEWSSPTLDWIMRVVTDFGSIGVAILAVVAALLYMVKRHTYRALFVAVAVGGAGLLNVILKLIFERPRPELWEQMIVEHSFSFPSGHAMASSALAFSAIVLFWRTKFRIPVLLLSIFYMIVIGFSRLYLGVHYPTDIIAGWLMSGAWVSIVAAIMWHRRQIRRLLQPLHDAAK